MRDSTEARPWRTLPPGLADVLRPELPVLATEIVTAIGDGVPEYGHPLGGPLGRGIRLGVEAALRQFVDLIGGDSTAEGAREASAALGRGEQRSGRTLPGLLAAYRLGARVAWRRMASAGAKAGLEPATLYQLAEAVFAYIDELSGAAVEGYAQEQSAAAGERQRRRQRLVEALLHQPPLDAAAIEDVAADARWPLPRSLAALAVDHPAPDRLAASLPAGSIAGRVGDVTCALVPEPEGRAGAIEAGLDGRPAAIGPAVPWSAAARSFSRAAAALQLVRDGVLPDEGMVRARHHAATLLLRSDPALARELAADRLAPLDGLPSATRERLEQTLLAWLSHQGRLPAAADDLHVHAQTVRYRLGQLRELFGERLDDPDARFELELALRALPLASPQARSSGSSE